MPRPSLAQGASLLLIAFLGQACLLRGARVDGDEVLGRTTFQVPEGWTLVRNIRWVGLRRLVLTSDQAAGTLIVEWIRTPPQDPELPLDLVAEAVVGDMGRSQGEASVLLSMDEVLLADRPAIALTGRRRQGPSTVDFTALVTRGERCLVVVHLYAPTGTLTSHTLALERVMNTLDLPLDKPLGPPFQPL